ncbi:MAG TPA: hypothetical protein VM597_32080, partial [Gemmataceae bacterium]|nr:hypothetical protein [Gemmataceae bacterium]
GALFFVFLVGGAVAVGLLMRNSKKTEPAPPKAGPPPPPRADAPPKAEPARELETLEKYLPYTAAVVGVADVNRWHSIPAAKQYLLEPLGRKLADLSRATGTDLTGTIERIGFAVVGKGDGGTLVIAQGRSLVTPGVTAGLKAIAGVTTEPAWDGGPDLLLLPGPGDGPKQYVGFTDTTALLSRDRGLVVEGLKKHDGPSRPPLADMTLNRGLGMANEKPFAVFVALGCRSDLAKSIDALTGLHAAAGGLYFEDRGMLFGVMAQEADGGSEKATEARDALGKVLLERAKAEGETDRRLERVARLLLDASRPLFQRRGLHSLTVIPTRQLGDWFDDYWKD